MSGFNHLQDPSQGTCTVENDKLLVKVLVDLCSTIWKKSYAVGFDKSNDYKSDSWDWITPELEFGKTFVCYWVMNHYAAQ